MRVKLVLGTMTFGQQVLLQEAADMVECFVNNGYNELDTAYVYNEGECEKIIGKIIHKITRNKVSIATKINPRISGRLDGEAVRKQLPESLERLGIKQADIVYLHFPDPQTPVEDALKVCDEMHRDGRLGELGLSNFPAWMVVDVYHKCKENNWLLPTVYEGVYNPLTRKAEVELFDALSAFGMRFYAYNPLAGGILTGKYSSVDAKPTEGRFALRQAYTGRYWKPSFFEAINIIHEACGSISMVEAVYRWLANHSGLNGFRGDAIIIGASKLLQLEENLVAIEKGPLPDELVEAFDKAWSVCKADSPEYFTLYTN